MARKTRPSPGDTAATDLSFDISRGDSKPEKLPFVTFQAPWALPTDPVYLRFRDGVVKANDDLIDKWRWRWHPRSGNWYAYSVNEFILDDVGLADTTPGYGFDDIGQGDPDYERSRADFRLPDTFRRVQAAYETSKARWPHMVWTWRGGGDWRSAIRRTGTGAPGPAPTDTDWKKGLTPECVQRVQDVRRWEQLNVITAADAAKLIRQIVADCTVG